MDSAARAPGSLRGGLAFGFVLQAGRWEAELLSPGLVALLGAETDAPGFVAAPLLDRVPAEDRRAWERAWAALAQGQPLSLVHRFRTAEGSLVRVQTEAVALEGAGETLRGVASCVPVEGARAEVRRRLREQMERASLEWQLALEAVPSPLLVLDLEGTVLRHNEAARALLGSGPDYAGQRLQDCAQAEPLHTAAQLVGRLQTGRGQRTARAREPLSDRSWELVANRVEGARGWGDRVVVLAQELTELLTLQAAVRHSEAMSQLGAIVAGVAHEVRNPLFAISAVTDALEEIFGPQLPGAGEYTGLLRTQVRRLTSLMQSLLEYGRPEPDTLTLGPVDALLREALAACSALAQEAGVRLQLEAPPVLPVLQRHPERLVQALVNLVSNAIQYSPRGGVVSVRAEVTETYGQQLLRCTVEDEGPGFAEEDLPRLAEPFFSRRRGGTGLGLSIVRRVVDEHQGSLDFSNREGGGGRVTLRFGVPAQEPTP